MVGADGRNDREIAGVAMAEFILQAVDVAFTRADVTGGQPGLEAVGSPLQLTGAAQGDVSWFDRCHGSTDVAMLMLPARAVKTHVSLAAG